MTDEELRLQAIEQSEIQQDAMIDEYEELTGLKAYEEGCPTCSYANWVGCQAIIARDIIQETAEDFMKYLHG
jgi:hypothetical protein